MLLTLLAARVGCEAQTVFLVRHAERADAGGVAQKDPDLSEIGRARANALAATLRDAKISAIFVTEFKRTQETAKPLAEKIRVEATVMKAKETSQLVARLKQAADRVLVVGHSNTLPEILKALGIATPPVLGENEYDDLFVLEREPAPHLVRLHYH